MNEERFGCKPGVGRATWDDALRVPCDGPGDGGAYGSMSRRDDCVWMIKGLFPCLVSRDTRHFEVPGWEHRKTATIAGSGGFRERLGGEERSRKVLLSFIER